MWTRRWSGIIHILVGIVVGYRLLTELHVLPPTPPSFWSTALLLAVAVQQSTGRLDVTLLAMIFLCVVVRIRTYPGPDFPTTFPDTSFSSA